MVGRIMLYRVPASSFMRASSEATQLIRDWLSAFAEAVRSRDLDAGRALFAPDVVAFGTFASAMIGLDELAERQWAYIWNRTRGFTFDFSELHASTEGDFAWAAVPWQSHGIAGDGSTFLRTGRATYILQRRGERWLAVHSHHSLNPASAQV
jgi:ketosteroid isomerase-like protein